MLDMKRRNTCNHLDLNSSIACSSQPKKEENTSPRPCIRLGAKAFTFILDNSHILPLQSRSETHLKLCSAWPCHQIYRDVSYSWASQSSFQHHIWSSRQESRRQSPCQCPSFAAAIWIPMIGVIADEPGRSWLWGRTFTHVYHSR